MTAVLGVTETAVRDYIRLEADGNSQHSDASIHSNLLAAAEFLERATERYFADRPAVTLTYTTEGRASLPLPGLRSISSVTWAGSTLAADTTYWLLPDAQQTGIFTGIQLRPYDNREGPWYLGVPDWFDRNLDHPYFNRRYRNSIPNDLVIAGAGGYLDADLPEAVKFACKILAGYFTLRPDSLLSGARQTPDGSIFDLSKFPQEVSAFIREWKAGEMAVGL